MNVFMTEMPAFIKKEMEQLQKMIAPLMKKASKYALWSWPLIGVSLANLVFLLFVLPGGSQDYISLIVTAVIGAFGFALSKEAKHKKKEIQHVSTNYFLKRIDKSDVVSEMEKKRYIKLIKEQPLRGMYHFVKFLEMENQIS
ncbi:YwnF family protein [Virgibacillus halophilus]